MLRDFFSIDRCRIVHAPKLYPNGIDWSLKPGINVIALRSGAVSPPRQSLLRSCGRSRKPRRERNAAYPTYRLECDVE
jgi:hypothetical protein